MASLVPYIAFDSKHLEAISEEAFINCTSLERIVVPLKKGMFKHDNTFQGCSNLNSVGLFEGEALKKTIAAFQLVEWKDDMITVIDSINRILPSAYAGYYDEHEDTDLEYCGEKSQVIRRWVAQVLRKVVGYKAKHH